MPFHYQVILNNSISLNKTLRKTIRVEKSRKERLISRTFLGFAKTPSLLLKRSSKCRVQLIVFVIRF